MIYLLRSAQVRNQECVERNAALIFLELDVPSTAVPPLRARQRWAPRNHCSGSACSVELRFGTFAALHGGSTPGTPPPPGSRPGAKVAHIQVAELDVGHR